MCVLNCKSQDFQYGIKFGMNKSSVGGIQIMSDPTNWKNSDVNKTDIIIGVSSEYKIKSFGFAMELLYSEQGVRYGGVDGRNKFTLDLNYLSLSPVVKFYVFKWLNLQLGAHLNYKISGDNTFYVEDSIGKDQYSTSRHTVHNWNYGLFPGIEICFGKKISISHRTYLYNNSVSDNLGPNSVSQFTLSYKI